MRRISCVCMEHNPRYMKSENCDTKDRMTKPNHFFTNINEKELRSTEVALQTTKRTSWQTKILELFSTLKNGID